MNVEQLKAALSHDEADPRTVLALLRHKRRRRGRRRILSGFSIAGLVAISVGVAARPGPQPSRHPVTPSPRFQADGCASISVADDLARAKSAGASVIVARGRLTGKTAEDGAILDQMMLHSVRTLTGPAVADGSVGWISGDRGPSGPFPGTPAGSLWAPGGQLFAIVWPRQAVGGPVGPVLRIAPLVNDQVIFSSAGCWDTTGLSSTPFAGKLAEIPGSHSYSRASKSPAGLRAVPLSTIEALIRQ